VRFRDDDMGNCHLAIAVKGATWTDPDAVTLMVMQTMLGAWDEARGPPPPPPASLPPPLVSMHGWRTQRSYVLERETALEAVVAHLAVSVC
jgi:hypothetical protein